jgi:hypothetical protein
LQNHEKTLFLFTLPWEFVDFHDFSRFWGNLGRMNHESHNTPKLCAAYPGPHSVSSFNYSPEKGPEKLGAVAPRRPQHMPPIARKVHWW